MQGKNCPLNYHYGPIEENVLCVLGPESAQKLTPGPGNTGNTPITRKGLVTFKTYDGMACPAIHRNFLRKWNIHLFHDHFREMVLSFTLSEVTLEGHELSSTSL